MKKVDYRDFTKSFFDFVEERYPSSDRALRILAEYDLSSLGLTDINKLKLKIAIMTMFRDAVREVDPERIFQSTQHRDEVYSSYIEALEELEEDLEEMEFELEEESFAFLETKEEVEEAPKEEKKEEKGFWDFTDEDLVEEGEWWNDEELF